MLLFGLRFEFLDHSSPSQSHTRVHEVVHTRQCHFLGRGAYKRMAVLLCCVWFGVCVSDDSFSLLSTIFQQVINLFLTVASFQALMEELGLERYYHTNNNGGGVTPIVHFSFTIGAAYTAIHSILVLWIQTFLTVLQLHSVCLYKLLVNLLLPQQNSKSWCSILFWSHVQQHGRIKAEKIDKTQKALSNVILGWVEQG